VATDRFLVGIDPGFVETGVVVLGPDRSLRAYATYTMPPGEFTAVRAARLAGRIATFVERNVPGPALIGCEYAVARSNVDVYRKQCQLLQAIGWSLWVLNRWLWDFVEVGPTMVKLCATGDGNANKAAMIEASPFARPEFGHLRRPTLEALADAFGVALASEREERFGLRLIEVELPQVIVNVEQEAT